MKPTRRSLIAAVVAGLATAGAGAVMVFGKGAAAAEIMVHKSPACGCCGAWVDYLRTNGFRVVVRENDDLAPIKRQLGVPAELESCHTASVDGYTIEGHVPVADVRRLLAERPDVLGLSVPGMPIGSPGMETGGKPDVYAVIAWRRNGSSFVFQRH